MIIQDIDTIGTSLVEIFRKSRQHWHAKKQTGPRVTLVDLVRIEESKENEVEEQHFVEEKTMQKDAREENVVTKEEHLSIKVQLKIQQAREVQTMAEAQ